MLVSVLRTFNQLLLAGVAITALSLWLYVLTFNLQDRVARSFALILACVTIVFAGEAMASVGTVAAETVFWLRFEWVGLIFLPASYFYASDALLETTGRPSRGRRRLGVRLNYVLAILFLLTLPLDWLISRRLQPSLPAPALQPAVLTPLFALYYAVMIVWAAANFWRAYRRTYTRTSRRRMMYLMTGATAPALGSYPYLLLGGLWARHFPVLFWGLAVFSNVFMSALLVLMAYALAFFGVHWPDRVVKRRLFRWILRGPVTASTVLAVATLTRRIGEYYGLPYSAAVPVLMVASILGLQYGITLFAPLWERWLFGYEGRSIRLVKDLEDRLLSEEDLRQFLETVLAAVCERLRSPRGFIAALGPAGLQRVISMGRWYAGKDSLPEAELQQVVKQQSADTGELFAWGDFWLMPLFDETGQMLLGLMVVARPLGASTPDDEQQAALRLLSERAALALQDHRLQQQVVESLSALRPQVDTIQRLRAATRYGARQALMTPEPPLQGDSLNKWVKDALSHFWGGPKLTESPLLQLQIVQQAVQQGESPANALREILRQAIQAVRPPGERRFTAEWLLYNILEMKFMEGRKVREIAMRLAMSEADFYRKQRVAIEEVARVMAEMEKRHLEMADEMDTP